MTAADLWLFFLQPPLFPPPPLTRFLPLTGPLVFVFLTLRLCYTILVLPLVLLPTILPPSVTRLRHPSWSLKEALSARLGAQTAWCLNYGLTLSYVEAARNVIPPRSITSYAKPLGVSVSGVRVSSSDMKFQGGLLGEKSFLLGEDVQGFWLEDGDRTERELGRQAGIGEKALLYLVGGGYIYGHPLMGPLAFELAKTTKCRVFCVNYRKARDPQTAFPGPLREAVAGWTYMLERGFKPENIYVVGNSAGGGLAATLTLYLSLSGFCTPAGVILLSPWLDLTMSNRTVTTNRGTDFVADELMKTGSSLYMQNFARPSAARPRSSDPEYLLSKESFTNLGPSHPILSPALLTAPSTILSPLAGKSKFLIVYGGAERLSGEIEAFAAALRKNGVGVEVDEERGAWHDAVSVPVGRWERQVGRVMGNVGRFVGGVGSE